MMLHLEVVSYCFTWVKPTLSSKPENLISVSNATQPHFPSVGTSLISVVEVKREPKQSFYK